MPTVQFCLKVIQNIWFYSPSQKDSKAYRVATSTKLVNSSYYEQGQGHHLKYYATDWKGGQREYEFKYESPFSSGYKVMTKVTF